MDPRAGALAVMMVTVGMACPAQAESPFDHAAGLAVYGTGWDGDYDALGVGGRARVELAEAVGVDVFAEAHAVDSARTERRDLVVGFDLYVPFSLFDRVRLRPLFGFCADFSFVDPHHAHGPRTDDIAFGVHAGAGVELGLGGAWSVFADAQQVMWFGHERYGRDWGGALDGEIEVSTLTQGRVGVQLHLF